jgi:FHS family Na+ dependent glucose MFS transporter 1
MRLAENGRLTRTAAYYVAFIALGLTNAVLGPTLPGLAEHTHSRLNEISFLFMAHALGYLVGSFQGGRLYDRVPGHPVMAFGLITMAAMLASVPMIPLLWLLTIALLLLGAAAGALDVGGNTLLVWIHGREVGPFMNGLHFFFGVGAFVSPILVAQAMRMSGDITWAYWMMALLVVPMAVWLLRLSSPAAPATVTENPAALHSTAQASRRVASYERTVVALTALLFLLSVAAEFAFGGWIFTYAVRLDLASETTAAYLTAAYWGALTFGRLVGIPIAARFRPRTILLVDLLGCLASLGVLLLWPGSVAATWLGTLGMGFFMASIFPTSITLAERRVTITGRITSWFLIGASIGSMSLPWLVGQFIEPLGPRSAMALIIVDLAAAVGVLAVLIWFSTRRGSLSGSLGYSGDQ